MSEQAVQTPEKFQTRYTEVELICPRCRARWSPAVASLVNFGTDPKAREGMLRKTMHHSYCPACKYHLEIDHIFSIYDPEEGLVIQVRPKWEFKAGGGEEMYWKRLEELILKHAEDDVRADVVFGFDELIEKHLGGQEAAQAALERAEEEKRQGIASGDLTPGLTTDDGTKTA